MMRALESRVLRAVTIAGPQLLGGVSGGNQAVGRPELREESVAMTHTVDSAPEAVHADLDSYPRPGPGCRRL
jgi:hypothetical protein